MRVCKMEEEVIPPALTGAGDSRIQAFLRPQYNLLTENCTLNVDCFDEPRYHYLFANTPGRLFDELKKFDTGKFGNERPSRSINITFPPFRRKSIAQYPSFLAGDPNVKLKALFDQVSPHQRPATHGNSKFHKKSSELIICPRF